MAVVLDPAGSSLMILRRTPAEAGKIERGPMEAALDIEAPSESVIRQLADIERLAKWVPKFRATMQVRRAGWRSFGRGCPGSDEEDF